MNRLLLALSLVLGAVPVAHAQYACDATNAFSEETFTAEIERIHGEYKAGEVGHEARLTQNAQALVDAGAWTGEDRAAFFASLLKDPGFEQHEQKKKQYLNTYQGELQLAFTDAAGACGHAMKSLEGLSRIAESSEAQFVLMEERLQQAAAAKGVTLPAKP